jgi:hypothetical protein
MPFTFPDPQATPEFTGDNGITYAWDADDSKWQVKTIESEGAYLPLTGGTIDGDLHVKKSKNENIFDVTADSVQYQKHVSTVEQLHPREIINAGILDNLMHDPGKYGYLAPYATKEYVDNKFSTWVWNAAKQSSSNYAEKNILWTYIDADTIKLNISQIPKNGQAWRYPGKQHTAVSFPINIQGMAANGKLVPVLCGTTSSIRSLDFGGSPYWQVYVPASNQFIWTPNAVPNMTQITLTIPGYFA